MFARHFIKNSFFIFAFFFCLTVTHADAPIPPIGRVVDLTQTITAQQVQQLSQQLKSVESKTGAQIAILIVNTTEPETIEQYSLRVEELWQLGQKDRDNGVLFVVAMKDKTMRIEVGYGLEGQLNDAVCKRIISDIVTPYFKKGQFFEGINKGVEQIIAIITGDTAFSNALPQKTPEEALPFGFFLIIIAIISVTISGLGWSIFGDAPNRKIIFAFVIAVITTIAVSIMNHSLLDGFWSGLVSFGAAILGYRKSSSSGSGGGGSDSGGSSSGGFSGGGGSSGGGGASGRW